MRKSADKRPRVDSKCGIFICNLLLASVKMVTKDVTMSVKRTIVRLKNQRQTIREIVETLGLSNSTVWYKKKKKNALVMWAIRNGLVDPVRLWQWMTPLQLSATSRGRCICVTTIRRRIQQNNSEGLPQDANHWCKMQNWTTDNSQINLDQSDGKRRVWRRKGTAHYPMCTVSSVKHGGGNLMAWAWCDVYMGPCLQLQDKSLFTFSE